jgi:pRiA4b ORF-3-like protein
MTFSTRARLRLGDVLDDVGTKSLRYLYDFGDCWKHTIKVERLLDRSLASSIRD